MDTKSNNAICSKTWTDLNIDLSKHIFFFCCKAKTEKITTLKLDDIIHAPGITQRRQDSLKGIKNSQCEYCWKTNSAYKNIHNKQMQIPSNPLDGIEFIELTLENTCNLSCLYCSASYSSTIAKEQGVEHVYKHVEYDVNQICEILVPIIKKRKIKFNLVGGEPTMSKFYYKLIEKLIDQVPNNDLYFITTSNGDMPINLRNRLSDYMNQTNWEWVWGFSGESADKVFENTRFHADYKRWLDNMKFFSNHSKTKAIALNPAVNSLCIKTFPRYIKDTLEILKDREYVINGNYVAEPDEFCISNLDTSFATYIHQARQLFLDNSQNCLNKESVVTWFNELENMIGTAVQKSDISQRLNTLNKQKQNKLDVDLLLEQID